jgi:ketosteroid isomerase-like protein
MNSEAEIRQTLARYYESFSTLDMDVIAPYFHMPAVIVGPPGVFPASDAATLATMFAPAIASLRAQDYQRSELEIGDLRVLGAASALVSGVAVRLKRDGSEIERVGLTYIMQKSGGEWKIAVLVIHSPDAG